jgi:transglutaminase-like putative cysteine protease
MRLDIRYRSRFHYDSPVWESQNELRACPISDDHQRLLSYRVLVSPTARVLSFTDYWGTRVDAFGLRRPHTVLEVTAEAAVETSAPPPPVADPHLDELGLPEFVVAQGEYLGPTRHTGWDDELRAVAGQARDAAGPQVAAVVLAISQLVHESLSYDTDATEIGISAHDVWARRGGVCQDYAHLAIAMCRSIGIPARYVSGYLFAADASGQTAATGDVVEVATHAWFEAALPGAGRLALDPTNGRAVGEEHVQIGHGRDYDDVTPLHGVHSGSAAVELDAVVEIRRGEQVAQRDLRPSMVTSRVLGSASEPATPTSWWQQQQ